MIEFLFANLSNNEIRGFILILFLLVTIIISHIIKNYIISIVKNSSKKYNSLLKINARYDFNNNLSQVYYFHEKLDSKRKFDRFDYARFFQETIERCLDNYKNLISMVDENQKLFKEYNSEISKISKSMSKEDVYKLKVPYKIYNRVEEKIFKTTKLKPVLNPEFDIQIEYTSPKGRNHYEDGMIYPFNAIVKYYNNVLNKLKRQETKEYQRNLMTNSLRYDILKRDDFRCVLCGRTTDDGVKLHVDHIKPVSKGGKTKKSNLRTLCDSCNLGKSDKYDASGIN